MIAKKECQLTHEEIARCAYKFWEEEKRPHGRDVIHWLRAVAHVATDMKHVPHSNHATGGEKMRLFQIMAFSVAVV